MATSFWQLIREYEIVIPILQRDFAQGRNTGKVPLVRERFLNSLRAAIEGSGEPLELDFIYGYTKENGNLSTHVSKSFVPLDGQQRLTTLFLLHWYVAVKEHQIEAAKNFLLKFTYETRHSSRVFCQQMVEFNPEEFGQSISETIIDQPWFFTAWKNDPNISSMLTMLNAIYQKFQNIDNIWPKLTSEMPRVVFHLLPMEKLGLPDDLYIKMNSRGKELTEFEHFKSRFSEMLNSNQADTFNKLIDQSWSDLFWDLYKNSNLNDIAKLADNAFLRFFNYVTDLLIAKNNIDTETSSDEFEIYQKIYCSKDSSECVENVDFLFACLNAFTKINSTEPDFFNTLFYIDPPNYQAGKVRLFFQNPSTDLFKKCAENYNSSFSIGEQLLLYACLLHKIKDTPHINARIRILRNLIASSEDTVRKEYLPSLLVSVSELIENGQIGINSKFNKSQISEEEEKRKFIESNSELNETLQKLEDHHLLQGCVAIFKLEKNLNDYAAIFHQVFAINCNFEAISRALLTFGNYAQKYDSWRWRFGNHNNSVWRELFTPSQRRTRFNQSREVLYTLLTALIEKPELTLEQIITSYLKSFEVTNNKPRSWEYYFIKYPEFRKNEDGFYTWWPTFNKQYECLMMRRTTLGGFHWSPFLYVLFKKHPTQLSLENYGASLYMVKGADTIKITNLNNGYKFECIDKESNDLLQQFIDSKYLNAEGLLEINQNQDDLDIEDRIEKCEKLIEEVMKV